MEPQQGQASAKPDVPCAGCRILHRKCGHSCMLAPYFLADEPEKFAVVHKVFGASNVIRRLQNVEEERREDAVKSLVYEAYARIRDPVYGCTAAISYLQKCVEELQGQIKATQERVVGWQEQRDQLLAMLTDDNMIVGANSSSLDYSQIHGSPVETQTDGYQML